MMSNLSFLKNRMAQTVAGRGNSLIVFWTNVSGGVQNSSTGAYVGGEESVFSGVMTALAVEEVPRAVLRQYQEIKAGDLIVECQPSPEVAVYPGQTLTSGTMPLSALGTSGLQFQFNGRLYVQATIGDDLAGIWNLTVQNVPMVGGLLLRLQT